MKPVWLGVLFVFAFALHVRADLVPHHVYLSLTGDSDSLQVTFTTSSEPSATFAQYWETQIGQKSAQSIFGTSNDTFTFSNPDSSAVDYITSFTFTNLTRETFYSYQVCGDAKNQTGTCSQTFTFRSLPNDNSTLNIGFFGDLGSNGTALTETGPGGLLQYAAKYTADLIVHNGDLAYNLATANGANGNDFLTKIEPITSKIPYVVTPGNHEFAESEDPIYYSNWFRGQNVLGQKSQSTNPTMWYSFDVGPNLHIIAVSTEVYCEDTGNLAVQHAWIEQDLQNVRARAVQPWVVMFGHRQMYIGPISTFSSNLMRLGVQCNDSTLTHCDVTKVCDSGENCAYSLEQLLLKYSVDLYVAGHVHTYVRMYPIAANHTYEPHNDTLYLNPQYPTYLISGAPGIQADYARLTAEKGLQGYPNYNVVKDVTGYSYSHMQVYNNTHVYITQIDVTTGDIVDYFWIVKDSSLPPWNTLESYMLLPSPEVHCD